MDTLMNGNLLTLLCLCGTLGTVTVFPDVTVYDKTDPDLWEIIPTVRCAACQPVCGCGEPATVEIVWDGARSVWYCQPCS